MNKKHILFCHKLLELNFNQRAAYQAVYDKTTDEAADSHASRLVSDGKVQEYLTLLVNQSVQDLEVTVKQVIHDTKNDSELARISGQLSVAMKGNELLGRHLGMFTDKLEHSGGISIDTMDKEELEKLHKKSKKK